jgi:hypothetical protein
MKAEVEKKKESKLHYIENFKRLTTVSSIVVTVSNISLLIAKAITNHRWSISKHTIIFMITDAFNTVICVDVNATVTSIIVAVFIVGLVIAKTISNQFQVRTI